LEITIGIPTYNERKNVIRILAQLKKEFYSGSPIKEVIIVDDSIDDTPQIINKHLRNTKYPFNIKFIHNQERKGVSNAWNTIFHEAKGDTIILLDADISLTPKTTKRLAKTMASNPKIGIVGCRTRTIELKSIAAQATKTVDEWLHAIRTLYPQAQFTIMGRALALRKKIARRIQIPPNTISVDLYLQCRVSRMGYTTVYLGNTEVFFKPPLKLYEFTSQIVRAYLGHKQLEDIVNSTIKTKLGLKTQVALFIRELCKSRNIKRIISTIIAYLSSLIYIPIVWKGASKALWETAKTTK